MNEQKRDKNVVKDAIGDPAFYNDQINKDKAPMKAEMDKEFKNKTKSNQK